MNVHGSQISFVRVWCHYQKLHFVSPSGQRFQESQLFIIGDVPDFQLGILGEHFMQFVHFQESKDRQETLK
jgi:hypothetical protein